MVATRKHSLRKNGKATFQRGKNKIKEGVANGGEGLELLVISRWTGLRTSNHHTRTYE